MFVNTFVLHIYLKYFFTYLLVLCIKRQNTNYSWLLYVFMNMESGVDSYKLFAIKITNENDQLQYRNCFKNVHKIKKWLLVIYRNAGVHFILIFCFRLLKISEFCADNNCLTLLTYSQCKVCVVVISMVSIKFNSTFLFFTLLNLQSRYSAMMYNI